MPGTVQIRPLSAKLTRDTELFGTMDPYCKIQLGKQNISGQVCKNGGKHPVWDETLVLKRVNEQDCHLQLKEHDWLLPDGVIGECDINLSEVETRQRVLKWYNLTFTGKPVGQILIEINYESEKGNNTLAPVNPAPAQQRVGPEFREIIPSGINNEAVRNKQFPGLTEVPNQNVIVQQGGFQPQGQQYVNNNDHLHQQYNAYQGNQQHDMFAPPVQGNINNYSQEGNKYPSLEGPYFNQQGFNQAHEVIDYRNQQAEPAYNNNFNDINNNNQYKYPGVTNVPLSINNKRDHVDDGNSWDPIRVIRGALGTR